MVNGKPWTGEVFDHRPIRPVRTQVMKTTAYSPDERSCGKWADGITASGKSVSQPAAIWAAIARSIRSRRRPANASTQQWTKSVQPGPAEGTP